MKRVALPFLALSAALLIARASAQEPPSAGTPTRADISADGKTVAYVQEAKDAAGQRSGSEVWVVGADGQSPRLVASGPRIGGIALSADGRRAAFLLADSGPADLWLVNTAGDGLRLLTRGLPSEQNPRFVADGSGILYVRAEGPQRHAGYLLDIAGRQEKRLLPAEFNASEMGPLPASERGVYAVCAPLGPDGKADQTLQRPRVVLKVPLDGAAPSPLYADPQGRSVAAFQAETGFKLAVVAGERSPEPQMIAASGEAKPLPHRWIARLSADGKLGVGVDLDLDIKPYVALYDFAKKAKRPLSGKGLADTRPKAAVDPAAFKKALDEIIAAAGDEFKAVRAGSGDKLTSNTVYGCSVPVPGIGDVTIFIPVRPSSFSRPYYQGHAYRGEDVELSKAAYRTLAEQVKAALPTWKLRETTETLGDDTDIIHEWLSPTGSVQVRVVQNSDPVLGARALLRVGPARK